MSEKRTSKETANDEVQNSVEIQEVEVDIESNDEPAEESTVTTKKKKSGATQQLKDELNNLNDRFLRLMAEYDNYRKRTEKERQSLVSLGTALALERFLPVLDTLEMATAAESKDPDYKKGVELTLTMFITALKSLGITEIEAENMKFDPNIHNCVATEESEDNESGIVLRVMQKGYCLNERVIRPASVTVSS